MSSFAVPASWGERRLEYELAAAADAMSSEVATLRDRTLPNDLHRMHSRILAGLAEKRRAIRSRLREVLAQRVR